MKCDLHIHSNYSYDSGALVKDIVDTAIKRGMDCIAITDHKEVKGALEAVEYAKNKPILIIPGIEVKTKSGDVLGLNVKEKIEDGLSVRETMKKIRESGGIAVLPHAFSWLCGLRENVEGLVGGIDGLEVLNASVFGNGNKKAFFFSQKHDLPFTCGSDAHFTNFIGKAYLEIPGRNLSIEEVISAIKNKSGKICGRKAKTFEKIIDHIRRNFCKIGKRC